MLAAARHWRPPGYPDSAVYGLCDLRQVTLYRTLGGSVTDFQDENTTVALNGWDLLTLLLVTLPGSLSCAHHSHFLTCCSGRIRRVLSDSCGHLAAHPTLVAPHGVVVPVAMPNCSSSSLQKKSLLSHCP